MLLNLTTLLVVTLIGGCPSNVTIETAGISPKHKPQPQHSFQFVNPLLLICYIENTWPHPLP